MDRFIKKLRSGNMVISGWSGQQDPMYLSMLAKTGFDAVTLDMQHGMQTENSVIRGIAAIEPTTKPTIIRIPVGRFDFVSRALDAGAHGIIAPMINTAEDARQLVSYGKYIPVGDRSYGPTQAAGVFNASPTDYVTTANDNMVLFAMIETKEAVSNMEAILDVDGVDGIFCGPGDLSISVRGNVVPDAYGPDTIDIVKKIAAEAHARGKLAATWCGNTDQVQLAQELGFNYAALGHDGLYVSQGVDAMLSKLSFR